MEAKLELYSLNSICRLTLKSIYSLHLGLLLGVPAQERDRAAANSVHARRRGEAEEPDWLHHLYDQHCPF